MWRALSNCLPTLDQLYRRHVPVQVVYPVCNEEEETVFHGLVKCSFASQCWNKVFNNTYIDTGSDFPGWFHKILHSYNKEKWGEVAVVCWAIWKARNEVVWQQKKTQVNVVVTSAIQYFVQWKNAQANTLVALFPNVVEGDGAVIWVKPQLDTIKVRVDAAMFEDNFAFGFGVVARDSSGELVQARTIRQLGRVTPEMAEAMAIKEALSWIKKQPWQKVELESDCLVVIQAIRSKVSMISQFGMIIEECRTLLLSQSNVRLLFIKRSANMIAQYLATASYSFPDRVFNRSDVPIEVDSCLLSDLSMQ